MGNATARSASTARKTIWMPAQASSSWRKADFSIGAWVKTTGTACRHRHQEQREQYLGKGEKSFYLDGAGVPNFVGFGNNYIHGTTAVNDGAWHHVMVTWDYSGSGTAGIGKIYVDGADDTASTTNYRCQQCRQSPATHSRSGDPTTAAKRLTSLAVGWMKSLSTHVPWPTTRSPTSTPTGRIHGRAATVEQWRLELHHSRRRQRHRGLLPDQRARHGCTEQRDAVERPARLARRDRHQSAECPTAGDHRSPAAARPAPSMSASPPTSICCRRVTPSAFRPVVAYRAALASLFSETAI